MLSIIVSSYQPKLFQELQKNIEATIGNIIYEVVQVWNPNKMSISQAYNLGVARSQYSSLLFVHEDVIFECENWGKILIDYIQNENIGCIGVAGSNYIPNAPVGWWFSKNADFRYLIQNNTDFRTINEDKKVILVDGVFIAIQKQKYLEFKFNEKLKGFHAYDIDFSQRVSQKYQNLILSKILINHFSTGKPDLSWFFEIVKTRKSKPAPQKIDYFLENVAFVEFCKILKSSPIPFYKKVSLFFTFLSPKYLGKKKTIKYLTSEFYQIF